jgi:hypothetical protein
MRPVYQRSSFPQNKPNLASRQQRKGPVYWDGTTPPHWEAKGKQQVELPYGYIDHHNDGIISHEEYRNALRMAAAGNEEERMVPGNGRFRQWYASLHGPGSSAAGMLHPTDAERPWPGRRYYEEAPAATNSMPAATDMWHGGVSQLPAGLPVPPKHGLGGLNTYASVMRRRCLDGSGGVAEAMQSWGEWPGWQEPPAGYPSSLLYEGYLQKLKDAPTAAAPTTAVSQKVFELDQGPTEQGLQQWRSYKPPAPPQIDKQQIGPFCNQDHRTVLQQQKVMDYGQKIKQNDIHANITETNPIQREAAAAEQASVGKVSFHAHA